MEDGNSKPHISLLVCGHVDSGKSTTVGHIMKRAGVLSERDCEKLKSEAENMGKGSFALAFAMDNNKEERLRGVTITSKAKEFHSDTYHVTIIDAPGHKDFSKNMITGTAQADCAFLVVPCDGNFHVATAKANLKGGIPEGQGRQHAKILNLAGISQVAILANKMDVTPGAPFSEERFNEIRDEMCLLLPQAGFKKKDAKTIPIIPMSGWHGDNIFEVSSKMPWWKGVDIDMDGGGTVHLKTVMDVVDKYFKVPKRNPDAPARMPVSGIYKIKGVGDVVSGRMEQGIIKPGDELKFLPTHQPSTPCVGKVFSVEMHHTKRPQALPGDNVGLNIKGLTKENMPRTGDVAIHKADDSLAQCVSFRVQAHVLGVPGVLRVGYSPIMFVRTGHAACRLKEIVWKCGKETGGKKLEGPHSIKSNELAELVFEPMQPFVVDTATKCEALSRIAVLEGSSVVMIAKCIGVDMKEVK